MPAECVWRSVERVQRDVGAVLRKQAREALEEACENKSRTAATTAAATIKHSQSTPSLLHSAPDDGLGPLARSMPDAQAADARKRPAPGKETRISHDAPAASSIPTSNSLVNSSKRQRGDEELYGPSDSVLEQWLASVPEVTPQQQQQQTTETTPASVASRPRAQRLYHCPSVYAPVTLPALPQAAYTPREAKGGVQGESRYVPLVDLMSLPPPPTLPISHASREEQPAKEGKGEGEEPASPAESSESSSSSSEHLAAPLSTDAMAVTTDAAAPPTVTPSLEEADREAAQEEWLQGALLNEGANYGVHAEPRPHARSPTDAHVALAVASALVSPPALLSTASTTPPPPASFTVSLIMEHFFGSVASALPALQLQTTPPVALRHLPTKTVDDAEVVPLEIPQVIAGYEDEWASVPPSVVPLWEKAVLEPYSPAKDIIFYVVMPSSPSLDFIARTFFRELSCMYEACRLGNHRPHDTEPVIAVERAANDTQLSAYSAAFQTLAKNLLKNSLSYPDSSFVVYIVHSFSRAPAAAGELHQLASEIVRECSGRNSLVNVVVQMLSVEEIHVREGLSLALKELAFSSFTKTRRVAFPHLSAKIYEPLFVLAPPSKEPKEPRENTLHVGVARSEDGLWEMCAVTDERGELLEVKPFLRASFSADALRREMWTFATQFLLGARDVRWRAAITCFTETLDEEERLLWREAVCGVRSADESSVPLSRVALLCCSIETQLQFLPAGLAPEEPAQTTANPLHFAVFPRVLRRLCRALDQAAPVLQAYIVSPAVMPTPNVPLPGEPTSVQSVVFYDFYTPGDAHRPPSAPPSPVAPAASSSTIVSNLAASDVQFARNITRQLHRLSFLTTSPAWPNRSSPLALHLAVLQRLASLIRQTTNFAAFPSSEA